MTSILKQENGELFIYRSEKEFPKREDYQNIHIYYSDRANWFSSSERIKVAEDECSFFRNFIMDTNRQFDNASDMDKALTTGIEIPESCYYKGADGLAYFKDSASEKETCDCPEGWVCVKCAKPENYLQEPSQNTSLDPKEHAIQFAEWLDSERYTRISTEHLYNQFINRK